MAPPANRRPTYSRRAQYGNFIGYVIAFIGLVAGALFLFLSTAEGGRFSSARALAQDAAAPAGRAAATSRSETRGFLATIGGFLTYGSRVARMERELDVARSALVEAQAVRGENQQLKALLKLADTAPRAVATARLIASTNSSSRRFATVGAGSRQGVAVGMPVRSAIGLVGRVLEVGTSTSRIMLITDTESIVPVRRASDGIPATAIGRADGTIQIKLVIQGTNPLKVGDAFVTSGSGGLFWPNTAIAVIARLTNDGGIASPLSDPGSADFVEVQPIWVESALPGPVAIPSPLAPAAGGR